MQIFDQNLVYAASLSEETSGLEVVSNESFSSDASLAGGCAGTAGTFGTLGGSFGTFGSYGSYGGSTSTSIAE